MTTRPSSSCSRETGAISWADTMVMPEGREERRRRPAKWMDFVYDPVQAAQITAWVAVRVAGRRACSEELEKIDPDLADEPAALPRRGDAGEHAGLRQSVRGRRGASTTPRSRRSPAPDAMTATVERAQVRAHGASGARSCSASARSSAAGPAARRRSARACSTGPLAIVACRSSSPA